MIRIVLLVLACFIFQVCSATGAVASSSQMDDWDAHAKYRPIWQSGQNARPITWDAKASTPSRVSAARPAEGNPLGTFFPYRWDWSHSIWRFFNGRKARIPAVPWRYCRLHSRTFINCIVSFTRWKIPLFFASFSFFSFSFSAISSSIGTNLRNGSWSRRLWISIETIGRQQQSLHSIPHRHLINENTRLMIEKMDTQPKNQDLEPRFIVPCPKMEVSVPPLLLFYLFYFIFQLGPVLCCNGSWWEGGALPRHFTVPSLTFPFSGQWNADSIGKIRLIISNRERGTKMDPFCIYRF